MSGQPHWAAKVDANQEDVVSRLRETGHEVQITSRIGGGFPDIIVSRNGETALMEIKDGKGELRPGQKAFLQRWKGAVFVVRGGDEAVAVMSEYIKKKGGRK